MPSQYSVLEMEHPHSILELVSYTLRSPDASRHRCELSRCCGNRPRHEIPGRYENYFDFLLHHSSLRRARG